MLHSHDCFVLYMTALQVILLFRFSLTWKYSNIKLSTWATCTPLNSLLPLYGRLQFILCQMSSVSLCIIQYFKLLTVTGKLSDKQYWNALRIVIILDQSFFYTAPYCCSCKPLFSLKKLWIDKSVFFFSIAGPY